ncbi:MAG: acetolactate decarboxylase [Lentisphaerae bacterium]|nr:acetolactate decarboxylase [Lentisphaerota bacterium]
MNRLFSVGLGLALLLAGCTTPPKNTVYQISTIDALLAGVYDGHLSCEELVEHGDFGIGTFDRLNGEMLVLDGEVFQVKADGKIYRPALSETTPFATVCQFDLDRSFPVDSEMDFDGLKALLDQQFSNQNLFYAIKLTGTFSAMKTRSVPAQQKPYPPLSEVTKTQPEFEIGNVSGTIVGFRCPPYVDGINVAGYHLHFLSDDQTQGGHILSFTLKEGTCEVDELNLLELNLPKDAEMFAEIDLSQDRSAELQQVEKD